MSPFVIYPNLRYGNPEHARAYCAGVPLATIARQLRRHPRTVRDWLAGRRKMPWWVPELLQLRHEVALHDLRRMGIALGPGYPRSQRSKRCPAPISSQSSTKRFQYPDGALDDTDADDLRRTPNTLRCQCS